MGVERSIRFERCIGGWKCGMKEKKEPETTSVFNPAHSVARGAITEIRTGA